MKIRWDMDIIKWIKNIQKIDFMKISVTIVLLSSFDLNLTLSDITLFNSEIKLDICLRILKTLNFYLYQINNLCGFSLQKLTRSRLGLLPVIFRKIVTEALPLIYVRILILLSILRTY